MKHISVITFCRNVSNWSGYDSHILPLFDLAWYWNYLRQVLQFVYLYSTATVLKFVPKHYMYNYWTFSAHVLTLTPVSMATFMRAGENRHSINTCYIRILEIDFISQWHCVAEHFINVLLVYFWSNFTNLQFDLSRHTPALLDSYLKHSYFTMVSNAILLPWTVR
jgi:hypothetical protein